MSDLTKMAASRLATLHQQYCERYEQLCSQKLQLSMARGLPAPEQVALSNRMLSLPGEGDFMAEGGVDCRNYTGLQGLVEARRLFSGLLGVPPEQVIVSGNSSLAFIYDCIGYAWRHGMCDSERPWGKEDAVSFLCPVPGYDRHFRIAEEYGIKLIPVPLLEDGPDMEIVRDIVANDRSVKGIWCVPKYSNPTGAIYSPEVIAALASMPTAATDFRLFWDNAYALHHLTDEQVEIANVVQLCQEYGHPDRALVFASTSKMTLAGSGVASFGSSPRNVAWLMARLSVHTVGPDKLNQLRHVRFLKDEAGLHRLMDQHRAILAPKFSEVLSVFESELGRSGIACWTKPKGGYFISLDVLPGCAKRAVELAKEAGITLTAAGAPFPGGRDPRDSNIRIAPSFATLTQIKKAAEAIALCVLLSTTEQLLATASSQTQEGF
jgi:aspartate/methionine/tyrosine aminotransferase